MPKENTIQESIARNRLTVTSTSSSINLILSKQLIPQKKAHFRGKWKIDNAIQRSQKEG
jgi:hypothetical protein